MIRWIQQRNWLPEILLASSVFLLLGGFDLLSQGVLAVLGSFAVATSLVFIRKVKFLTPVLLLLATTIQIGFGLLPIFGSIGVALAAFVSGAFSPKIWREVNLAVAMFSGLLISANLSYNPALNLSSYGLLQITEAGRLAIFVGFALLAMSVVVLAWISGQLLITRLVHVGTEFDRLVYEDKQLKLAIELAEQSKRFEIAKDINEAIMQRIASVMTNADGGIYAAKSSPEAGLRALEKIQASARSAHAELRRLFDTINRGSTTSSAPPRLSDLEDLAVSMRESGLDVEIAEFGESVALDQSAELAIFRIVFEALQNVRQHNPKGTKAKVEISWLENGLQVMIKDNGVEVERRANLGVDGLPMPYDAQDDLDTLLEKVTGPGLTAMKERAESFGGSLEVQRVVGIGFTVSAMFPFTEILNPSDQAK